MYSPIPFQTQSSEEWNSFLCAHSRNHFPFISPLAYTIFARVQIILSCDAMVFVQLLLFVFDILDFSFKRQNFERHKKSMNEKLSMVLRTEDKRMKMSFVGLGIAFC